MNLGSIFLILLISLSTSLSFADSVVCRNSLTSKKTLSVGSEVLQNQFEPFDIHRGPGPFDNVLAMNISYSPVIDLRLQLNAFLGLELKFFDGWKKEGEGHVTTITPTEYTNVIKDFLTMDQIDQIARENNIQQSDVTILGLGSAKKEINGEVKETFFLIVESQNLRLIRQKIFEAYVQAGGDPIKWEPFYPHITIGYVGRDLHFGDGVLKDIKHSLDPRFDLVVD